MLCLQQYLDGDDDEDDDDNDDDENDDKYADLKDVDAASEMRG